jgi:guanine deaminase
MKALSTERKTVMPSSLIDNTMKLAIERAKKTMNQGIGGPFGAAILDEQGELIALASNSVLRDHDATAHAEINAIREASKTKGTHDLSGCTLITTCYPCPMCLSAIVWANIKTVHYGANAKDAAAIGFRDDMLYCLLRGECAEDRILELHEADKTECLKLSEDYDKRHRTIY